MNDYAVSGHRFAEIEKWIPHIKGMGFNAVLFSPVLKSRSHGYDVTDYFEIDNRLGTNAEFASLVRKFHENGIRIILDCVFNHCGRDFFAFQELKNNNRNYAEWFSGVDFSWQSPMGDPFTYDTWSGCYELPKFNLQNAVVRNYLLDAARFWIDTFAIDGMRLDAADVLDFDFMAELRRLTEAQKPDLWLMGEVVHGDYSKWINASALHSVTNYSLHKSLVSSHNDNNLHELASCVQNSVPDNGLPLHTFLDNHDINRIASNTAPEHLSTLYTLLYTLPGIPSVYYGSEWGFHGLKKYGSDQDLRPFINIENSYMYDSWLTGHIKKLLRIRQSEKALRYGAYKQVYLEYQKPFVFERSCENERLFIAINIANHSETIDLSNCGSGKFRDLLWEEQLNDSRHIQLRPYSARVLREG
jgi:glycosidase